MAFKLVVGIILIVFSVFLIVAVLLQESKKKGLSGAISGGSSDTFYGKSKTQTKEKILSKLTLIVAIAFTVITIVLYVGQTADSGYSALFDRSFEELQADLNEEETTAAEAETTAPAENEAANDEAEEN